MCECFTRLTGKDWSHHPDLTRFHFLEQIRKQMGRGDRLLQGHTAQKWQRWALPTSLTSILAQFNPKSLRLSFYIYIRLFSQPPCKKRNLFPSSYLQAFFSLLSKKYFNKQQEKATCVQVKNSRGYNRETPWLWRGPGVAEADGDFALYCPLNFSYWSKLRADRQWQESNYLCLLLRDDHWVEEGFP